MSIPSVKTGLSFVPPDVIRAMETIHAAGFDVWIVGGALRDHLIGGEPKDWDIATDAAPDEVVRLFPRVIPVGIRHGTVQVHTRKRDIEVTSYSPSGETGILKDLSRRDFTINAMALSYPEGVLIDPHGGREDLKKGLIRGVGDSRRRFAEDALRIVRASRLAGTLGFDVDRSTFNAMREEAENVGQVSGERIRDEFCKILLSRYPIEAFDLLRKGWALGKLLPELVVRDHVDTLPGSGMSILRHALLSVRNCPERLRVRLAALFQNAAVPADGARGGKLPLEYAKQSAVAASARLRLWHMSNRQIQDVAMLIEYRLPPDAEFWSDARIRRFIVKVGTDLLEDFTALAEAERRARGIMDISGIEAFRRRISEQLVIIPAMRVQNLALKGSDVMQLLGLVPGPEVGRILQLLFDVVLEDPALNTRECLMEFVTAKFGSR